MNAEVTNIGSAECRKRRKTAIAAIAFTVVLFVTLNLSSAAQSWYLLLFIPAWVAMLGLLQAREKT